MENTYYLISCPDRESDNIAVVRDRRDMKSVLETILQSEFDDETIRVIDIRPTGKDYERKFVAHCKDEESYKFKVKLERVEVWD